MATQNLKDFYEKAQTEPVLTTVGRSIRDGASAVGQGAAAYKTGYNNAPKVVGKPAAAVANAFGAQLAALKSGLQGTTVKAPEYQALSFSQMWDRTAKPGIAPAAAAPIAAPAVTAPAAPAAPTYTPGAGLPSMAQVTSDKSRANAAQAASDLQMGLQPAGAPAATGINVQRQANGVLSFSGNGGGDGTGAVNYTGLPSWKSAQGGAGQGAVDFGGQAFKPAQAAVAGGGAMANYAALAGKIAAGEGGAVGVAQNKIALAALAPILERQMSNDNSTSIAKMETETRRRGQDLGLEGEMARTKAAIYGTDVGARTAAADREVEKERNAVALSTAKAKASGNPEQVRKAQLLELEYAAKTGIDPNTGVPIDEAQRMQLYQRVLELKTPQTVVPYGGFGMAAESE